MIDPLLEQFLIESRDLLVEAAGYFAALERDPRATVAIDGAFRAIHTLKGSVALFDMRPAETVLHRAEDVMERARKGTGGVDAATIRALVACLDQVDRWIDAFEARGTLPDDADAIAQACLAQLAPLTGAASDGATQDDAVSNAWVVDLVARDAAVLASADGACVAFRYTPDADCFFRGDDPLAVVKGVPDLLGLAVLPAGGKWPDAASIEPFQCFTVLEGISAAPLDAVRACFRMMPDQVLFAVLPQVFAEASASDPAATGAGVIDRSMRVDPVRIDAMGNAVGELLVAMHGFHALAEAAEKVDRALATQARAWHANLERVTGNLRLTLGALRSVPLETHLRRLPRLAREIAETLGKPVEFAIEGQDIEVDRQVAERIFEPLLHLVRNAIDHGIESADQRRASGKPPVGKVVLRFRRERDLIIGELSDDGRGIDPQALRGAAVDRGLLTAEAAAGLTDAAALRLIFLPGFSTARAVTDVSGRGVGMDAVQAAVTRLRGSVEIKSEIGQGTTFVLALPATTLTTRLLVVETGGARYGITLDQIVETVGYDRARPVPIAGGMVCVLRDRTVPVLDLAQLLGDDQPWRSAGKLVIVQSGADEVALRVDGFGERIDTLVKPAGGLLAQVPGVAGSTLMSNGDVLLVLDLMELIA